MPDIRPLLLGLALGLAACSGDATDTGDTPSGNEEFVRLIEDARFEMGRGDLAEAGRLYDLALEIDRQNSGLWVDIARLRFRGGEHVGALEAADFALELDPQNAQAIVLRGQLVRDAFGLAESLVWFESGLATHPDNVDLLAEYAATLGDLGRHSDMLEVARELATISSRDPRVHYLQAVLAVRANDPILASSLLKRSGMREAGVPAAILVEALLDMQQGNYDTAATSLDDLLNRQPGNVRVMELLARALWLNGRDREVVDRFGTAAGASDASPYLVELVGRSLERLGERREAVRFLERATQRSGGDLILLPGPNDNPRGLPQPTWTMRQFVNSAQQSEARRYSRELLERFPQSSDVMVLAGDAALARGDAREALDLYGRAAQVRRPWPLTKKIIYAYRLVGDDDAAETLLDRHLRTEPRNIEALTMLAKRSTANEDWLRAAVVVDALTENGAGNDPELLTIRLEAAKALEDEDKAAQIEDLLGSLRPASFTRQ